VQTIAAAGCIGVKELTTALKINSRRAYDLLNVLSVVPSPESPLVKRRKTRHRTEVKFLNGEPWQIPCVRSILNDINDQRDSLQQLIAYMTTSRHSQLLHEKPEVPQLKKD